MTEPIRRAQPRALALFIAAHFALTLIVNLILFARNVFQPLAAATGGLVTGTLIANLLLIGLLVGGIILRVGQLRPYDVGLIPRNLPVGIAGGVCLWLIAQAIHLMAGVLANGHITLHPAWAHPGTLLGLLVAQVFGNALFEEIAYRGFLFPQFYLMFERLVAYRWGRFFAALIASQAVFALSHIPNRLYFGIAPGEIALDLVMLLGWGALYTFIYMRTDNLFLAVAVHALGNAPTTLFATAPALDGAGASFLLYAIVIIALFGLPLARASWSLRTHAAAPAAGD